MSDLKWFLVLVGEALIFLVGAILLVLALIGAIK